MLMVIAMTTQAQAEGLVLYGAGSLREAMVQIAALFSQAHGLAVATQFGPVTLPRDQRRIPCGVKIIAIPIEDVRQGTSAAGAMHPNSRDGLLEADGVWLHAWLCERLPRRPRELL